MNQIKEDQRSQVAKSKSKIRPDRTFMARIQLGRAVQILIKFGGTAKVLSWRLA